MVCMGVSKFGRIDMIFIDAVVKIDGVYHSTVTRLWLKSYCLQCVSFFIFQRCNATSAADRAINTLERQTPAFISQ